MLSGPLTGPIFKFALPLIATGFLQQSFNSADTLIVGRYCPSSALAAVGSNGPIVNLIITLFMGLGVGVNVVIASCIGRRDHDGVRRAVATTGILALACGLIMTVLGMFTSRLLLEALGTPEDVLDSAATYLRIFFLSMPFIMIYNFGAAILRSKGDTARPFYILIAGSVTNIALNLLFIDKMDMGVAGVALATVIGIGVNATLITVILLRETDEVKLVPKQMKIYRNEFSNILRIGLPAGVQGLIFSLSNVFILSSINTFGSAASAGSAAALNYEIYCYFLIVGFVQATVAFTSQNYAAGNFERCKKVFNINFMFSCALCLVFNVVIVSNRHFFVGLFTNDPAVMPFAFNRLTMVLLFQFVACSYEISGAALRAMGYSMTPTVITIFGTCVFRLLWVFMLPMFDGTFSLLMAVYPMTWVITGGAVVWAYLHIRHKAFKTHSPYQKSLTD